MKTSKALLLCTIAILALSIGGIYAVYAENQDEGDSTDLEGRGFFAMKGWGMPFRRVVGTLTEEQRNELASEIQDLVTRKFEEWGIELPEPILSEEQRSELQAGIEQLREDGATREEIREFIAGKLEEWGIEPPEFKEAPFGLGARGFWPGLSEEQRDELMSGIQELRDADASHEEIKEYINGKQEEWGIEQPEPPGRMCGFQRGFGRRKGKFGNDTG